MKCDFEELHFYLDDYLKGSERERVENHLLECPLCQDHFGKIERAKKALASLSAEGPSFDFFGHLEESIERELTRKATTHRLRGKRRLPGWLLAIPLAACLLLALYLSFTALIKWRDSQKIQNSPSAKGLQNPPEKKAVKKEGPLPQPEKKTPPAPGPSNQRFAVIPLPTPQTPPKENPERPEKEKTPPSPGPKKESPTPEVKKTPPPRPTKEVKKKPPQRNPLEEYKKIVKRYLASKKVDEKGGLLTKLEGISIPQTFGFLRKVLQGEPSPHLRRQALLTLGALGTGEGARTILLGLMDPSWLVQDGVGDALKRIGDAEGTLWVEQKMLRSTNLKVRQLAIETLACIGTVDTHKNLARAYGREQFPLLKARILLALGNLRAYDEIPLIKKATRSLHWQIRQASALAAGDLADDSLIPALVRLLKDRQDLVRQTAALSLGKYSDPKVVAHLKKTLKAKDRDLALQGAVRRSIEGITGKKILEKPLPAFSGIPLCYNRVLFLVDVSGSMKKSLPLEKKMLTEALQALPPQSTFNILVFSNRVVFFSRGFVRATPAHKEKGYHFIRQLKVHPQLTDLHKALQTALQAGPDGIFLISDGSSTTGKFYQDPSKILREVAKWNLFQRTRIHSFGLFKPDQEDFQSLQEKPIKGQGVDFLLGLSRLTGGRFLHNY